MAIFTKFNSKTKILNMKRIASMAILLLSLQLMACDQKPENKVTIGDFTAADSANFTQVQWLDSVVNFGTIQMGETKTVTFRMKNIGNKPLFLTNVKAGCGCTVADFTKGAIAPGGEGMVTGEFDSNKSQTGEVHKSIFVTTNTPNGMNQTLVFTGKIEGHKALPVEKK
jgi:hypothetical protein